MSSSCIYRHFHLIYKWRHWYRQISEAMASSNNSIWYKYLWFGKLGRYDEWTPRTNMCSTVLSWKHLERRLGIQCSCTLWMYSRNTDAFLVFIHNVEIHYEYKYIGCGILWMNTKNTDVSNQPCSVWFRLRSMAVLLFTARKQHIPPFESKWKYKKPLYEPLKVERQTA